MTDSHPAWLGVDLEALADNYRLLRQRADGAAAAAVVKADGYGLGAVPVARRLAAAGCDTFFLARLAEAVALRRVLPRARLFLFDGADATTAPTLLAHRIVPVLNSLAQIRDFAVAAPPGTEAAIHIDSGMNRLGLTPDEVSILAAEWRARLSNLSVVLWISHLACADAPDDPSNAMQLSRFRAALARLPPAPASLAASGGIFLGRDYRFDLVRPGIALYGGNPRPGRPNPLRGVAFLGGRVLQTRRIDKGETVGYGATFRAKRPTMLATVALGYADGLPRALSNRGGAFLGGARVTLAGRVSMDLIALDVTDAGPVAVGDVAELLGPHVPLEDVAAAAGTNSYEILTGLSRRVPRLYAGETP